MLGISIGPNIAHRCGNSRITLRTSLFLCSVIFAACLAGSTNARTNNFSCEAFDATPETSTCSGPTSAISMERQQDRLLAVAQSSNSHAGESSQESAFSAILDQRIRTRCHMDFCGWFAITARNIETEARDGVLYRVDSHWWSAEYPDGDYDTEAPLEDDGQDSSFVFCSLTRPATFTRDGENWIATALSPNDPEGVFGYNTSAYIFYFAACHGAVTDAGDSMTDLAERLGYQTSANQAEQGTVSTPQEYIEDW